MSKNRGYKRAILGELVAGLDRHPSVIQVLVGPRQVGKTTLARQLIATVRFPSVYASADAALPPGPEWIETQWRQAEIRSRTTAGPVLLVLDEVQKVRG